MSSLKQLKKQHKSIGFGTRIISCTNSDSNFPNRFRLILRNSSHFKIFFFFDTNLGCSRNQGAKLCAFIRPESVFFFKSGNLKIDWNAFCKTKKNNIPDLVLLKLFTNMTVPSDHSVQFEWDLVQNKHQSILCKKCQKLTLMNLSSLKQLKKHCKETGLRSHNIICTNSGSNFPKQVPVDFKKFLLV